jgi:hypothetical protein
MWAGIWEYHPILKSLSRQDELWDIQMRPSQVSGVLKPKKKRKTGMVVLNVIPALWRIAN